MLSYAFHVLNEKGYNKIATEDFENTADLFSEILINAVGNRLNKVFTRIIFHLMKLSLQSREK